MTDYWVTGDLKDFPAQWRSVSVVTPKRVLEILGSEGADPA
jgi:hypothetical protein